VDKVAYELMNEAVADDPEQWNRLIEQTMADLRRLEPGRVVVIGSNRWQSVNTFDALRIPENDPHIILSFHFYTPMVVTHYKASWTTVGRYTGPVHYPGRVVEDKDLSGLPKDLVDAVGGDRDFDRKKLERMLEKPLRVAEETGLPLYCGEWGCLPTVPEKDRLAWYSDMRKNLERHGIAWATWDYMGGFGLRDREGKPVEKLIRVLLK
jgi:endoglucanase